MALKGARAVREPHRGKWRGPVFFGDPCFYALGLRLTKSYPPSEGGIKPAAVDTNTVNNLIYHLHSHAKRGNEKTFAFSLLPLPQVIR